MGNFTYNLLPQTFINSPNYQSPAKPLLDISWLYSNVTNNDIGSLLPVLSSARQSDQNALDINTIYKNFNAGSIDNHNANANYGKNTVQNNLLGSVMTIATSAVMSVSSTISTPRSLQTTYLQPYDAFNKATDTRYDSYSPTSLYYNNGSYNDTSYWEMEMTDYDFLYRHSLLMTVVYCIAYVIVFLVGLVGNSFVIAVVLRMRNMRTVTNYFIVNLAIADILVIVFCLPATLMSNIFVRKYLISISISIYYYRVTAIPSTHYYIFIFESSHCNHMSNVNSEK